MALHIVDHPLAQHKLTLLRDKRTSVKDFRALLAELTLLLAVEATGRLAVETREVETPLALTRGAQLAEKPVVVPILRAGLGMADAFLALVPDADVGHIGLYREAETHEPVEYYIKMPPGFEKRPIFILDPMLATGGSALFAIDYLKRAGARSISLICVIAASEGVHRIDQSHPRLDIFAASLDERLDERAYIIPGLGDAGDRLYGTSTVVP